MGSTGWSASNWQTRTRTQLAQRGCLQTHATRAMAFGALAAASGLLLVLTAPRAGNRPAERDYAVWAAVGGLGTVVFGLCAIGAWVSFVKLDRRTAVVGRWCAAAGPKALTTLLHGGPKLGVDRPIDDFGANTALTCLTPPLGAPHPLLAVGTLVVSGLINGVAYLKNKGERSRRQAALTAEYLAHSRERLMQMRQRYAGDASSTELLILTNLALSWLPGDAEGAVPVCLIKAEV